MAAPHRARAPSLTEFPDSPSVYSHAYHSPDPYPDFDDETASTIRSFSADGIQDCSDLDDCTDDASYRISLQGPRIRFHSRAPWETEDVPPHTEEYSNARSAATGNKSKAKTSRADHLIRTFTRGSSIGSRPSVDSAYSQVSETSSFEVTAGNYSSSRGALYDLARQLSSSSLTSSVTSASSLRSQSFARATGQTKSSYYAQTYDSVSRTTVSLDGMVPTVTTLENTPIRPSSSDISRVGHEHSAKLSLVPSSQERRSHDTFVHHPYANPDLVAAYTSSPETIPSHHPISGDMSENDSNSVVTDSTSTRSAAFSHTSVGSSTISSTSRDVSHGNRRVNGKEISSPISALRQSDHSYVDHSTRFLSLHPPPVGFEGPLRNNLNSRSPTVTLISLQEAQAREERFRSSTVHATVTRQKLPFPSSDDIPEAPEDETIDMDTGEKMAHTRARSTSVGTRHNTVSLPSAQPQNIELRDESAAYTSGGAVPGRTLKHKKSGFMRLFGGRSMEGEKERSPPPPIPPLADVYTEETLQIHGAGKTSRLVLPKASKSSPALRSSGASNATLASVYSAASDSDGIDGKEPSSRRRQPPSLSIVTKTSDPGIPTSVLETGLNFTPSPLSLAVPQSAPPGNSDFPGLKLRPVSTSFSSHFAGMVACTVEELQNDVHTPSSATSSNTALSPFTPVSTRRSDGTSATTVEAPGEGHLTIKGLQDQLVSAKQAWQQQIWELRGQIRDLTSELEDLRAADDQEYCEVCGRGEPRKRHASPLDEQQRKKVGVVNRPRARTGDTARFVSGN